MKALIASLLAVFLAVAVTVAGIPPVTPDNDWFATIRFAPLPCDDGWLFAYTFTKDIPLQQKAGLLKLHIDEADDLNRTGEISTKDKIIVVIYMTPTKAVTLTADYKESLIEIRIDKQYNDKFYTGVWKGSIATVISRIDSGELVAPDSVVIGERSKEKYPPITGCPSKDPI